jgi:glyoxylase-like metal-dependent hydrolase (beta-lactamase superfamily II)
VNARVDHAVTSGTFSLDGQTFEVDNNVWVVGDDAECVVLDAPHDVAAILDVVGGRTVRAIIATHAHDDHVRVAPELAAATGAPILLHPADLPVWRLTHPRTNPDGELTDGQDIEVGGTTLRVLHTPGHSPGSCCLHTAGLGAVFTGDTLFKGGPGATGRSFSDFGTIITSIREKLLPLPGDTVIDPGHGESSTIGDEAPDLRLSPGGTTPGLAGPVRSLLRDPCRVPLDRDEVRHDFGQLRAGVFLEEVAGAFDDRVVQARRARDRALQHRGH